MTRNAIGSAVLVTLCLAGTQDVRAELQPISETEMGQVQGQAMIAVDQLMGGSQQFTRITMGMDIDVQTNVNALAIGETAAGTDLAVEQLSLGHLSEDEARIQLDGQTYAVGEIVPFEAANPYFELAQVNNDVVGFRLGFGQARGTLSGDVTSFSGHLGLQLQDASGTVAAATLYDATTTATNYQATHVGLAGATTDCASGVQCAPLSNLKTLEVGADNGDGTAGFAEDFFLAFQQQAVDWQNLDGGRTVTAAPGVHLNLPTAMTIDLQTLQDGIPRARTEYIDRGLGAF